MKWSLYHYPFSNFVKSTIFNQLVNDNTIDLNAQDEDGWTPHNFIHLVKLLVVENGTDVTIKTHDEWNPLLFVCHNYGHDNLIEVVKCFTENDVIDVNDKDQDD